MKVLATTKSNELQGEAHLLKCALCAEPDRNKLAIEDMCLGIGMGGDVYCFCQKCWGAKDLGQKLLNLLGYPMGIKIKNECLDLREVE